MTNACWRAPPGRIPQPWGVGVRGLGRGGSTERGSTARLADSWAREQPAGDRWAPGSERSGGGYGDPRTRRALTGATEQVSGRGGGDRTGGGVLARRPHGLLQSTPWRTPCRKESWREPRTPESRAGAADVITRLAETRGRALSPCVAPAASDRRLCRVCVTLREARWLRDPAGEGSE